MHGVHECKVILQINILYIGIQEVSFLAVIGHDRMCNVVEIQLETRIVGRERNKDGALDSRVAISQQQSN